MAEDWGLITANPAAGIKQARERIVEQDYLSEDEVLRLIDACDDRIRPLIVTAVNTGMRWGELVSLEWRDVYLDREDIYVRDPKNREDRHVPLNSEAIAALWKHRRKQTADGPTIVRHVFVNPETGRPWKDIRTPLSAALKAAGIRRSIPFRNLRHTAASHMVMRGVDIRTVGQILGHKTLQVTMRYAHLSSDHLKEAIARLTYSK